MMRICTLFTMVISILIVVTSSTSNKMMLNKLMNLYGGKDPKMISFRVDGLKCHSCLERIRSSMVSIDPNVQVTLHPPLLQLATTMSAAQINTYLKNCNVPYEVNYNDIISRILSKLPFLPIILIVGSIAAFAYAVQINQPFDQILFMHQFMGGVFVTLSTLKIANLKSFVSAFSAYDLLAQKLRIYAWAYPFIEFAIGLGYLLNRSYRTLNIITFILMSVSSIGVAIALAQKKKLVCACLGGGYFKMPMTYVTLIEDGAMAIMALVCLLAK